MWCSGEQADLENRWSGECGGSGDQAALENRPIWRTGRSAGIGWSGEYNYFSNLFIYLLFIYSFIDCPNRPMVVMQRFHCYYKYKYPPLFVQETKLLLHRDATLLSHQARSTYTYSSSSK